MKKFLFSLSFYLLLFSIITVFQINLFAQSDLRNETSFHSKEYIHESFEDTVEISEKSPWLAFFLSYVFPGMGQIYNGEIGKAFLFMGGIVVGGGIVLLGVGSLSGDFETTLSNDALVYSGIAVAAISYLWSLIDAPVSAERINDENRILIGIKTSANQEKIEAVLTLYF